MSTRKNALTEKSSHVRRRRAFLGAIIGLTASTVAACSSSNSSSISSATTGPGTSASSSAATSGSSESAGSSTPGTSTGGSAAAGAHLAPGNYKIGYLTETTGNLAFAGTPSVQGVTWAIDDANKQQVLGPGVTIELVEQDNGGDAAQAIAAAGRFIADNSYLGVICCLSSGVTGAVLPVVDKANVPTVITSAVAPTVTHGAAMFRAKPLLQSVSAPLVPKVLEAVHPKTAVITRTIDNQGNVAAADVINQGLTTAGVKTTLIDVQSTQKDLTGVVSQIINVNPDVVIQSELAATMPVTLRGVRASGFAGPIFGAVDTILSDTAHKTAGDAAIGVVAPTVYNAASDSPEMKTFMQLANAQANGVPPIYAAEGYAAAQLLIAGLHNAAQISPTPTRADLMKGLGQVTTIDTVLGAITMNDQHQGIAEDPSFLQWSADGKIVPWDGTAAGIAKK